MDLFTLVKAQGADDAASPTIPFPPAGALTPTPTVNVNGPTISLATNTISMRQGDKATVQVIFDTKGKEIKGFTLMINYNPALFKITDANPTVTGTQIFYTNTYYIQQVNTVDESRGVIVLQAASQSGTGTITNMVMAQFEVTALANGAGTFQLVQNNSSLLDYTGTDILGAVNSVVINVSNVLVTTTPTVTPTPSETSTPMIHPSITGGPITPRTALNDDIGNVSTMILGTVLIIAGYYLFRKKRSYDLQR